MELPCKGRLPSVAFGSVPKNVKVFAYMTNAILRLDAWGDVPEFWVEVLVDSKLKERLDFEFDAELVGTPGKHTLTCTLDDEGRHMIIKNAGTSDWSMQVDLPACIDVAPATKKVRLDAKKAAIVVFTTEDPLDATVCTIDLEKLREAYPAHAAVFERDAIRMDEHPEKSEMFQAVAQNAFEIPYGDSIKVMFACTVYDAP